LEHLAFATLGLRFLWETCVSLGGCVSLAPVSNITAWESFAFAFPAAFPFALGVAVFFAAAFALPWAFAFGLAFALGLGGDWGPLRVCGGGPFHFPF
jgi:hypothetical protein